MIVKNPNPRSLLNSMIVLSLGKRPISILEAGGGSHSVLILKRFDITDITTLDISPEQLARNDYAHVKIEGDLETYRHEQSYDLVIVYNVLEHLSRADKALAQLTEACSDNGVFVVGSPYEGSFSGMVTRFTPHWVHLAFRRHVMRQPNAGKPGFAPFPTHYHPLTEPERLRAHMEEAGSECVFLALYESPVYRRARQNQPLSGWLLTVATSLINFVTPKSYGTCRGDYHAVFRKSPAG